MKTSWAKWLSFRTYITFMATGITSDAGILLQRELDEALGLTDLAGAVLSEHRRARTRATCRLDCFVSRYLAVSPVMTM